MTNVWSDVTEQPILVIKSEKCDNVIADSTRGLQQCIQEQLTHLDNRARALATSGNFEAALKDATRIRQLVPSSADGYLCAGHVYSLQGRQEAAIDIYDQGLAAVPSSDPTHQQLVEARSMAQERDSTRIDFIKELPIDIIENIAPWVLSEDMLTPSEIREYLDVSPVWRERLLFSIRDLHIESLFDDDLGDDDDLLEQVAPHCTALTLQCSDYEFAQLMSKAPFPSLQTLITRVPWRESDDITVDETIDTLASLGSTLKHLEIKTTYGYDICFGDLLSSCPNLEYLKTCDVVPVMLNGPECHRNLKTLLFGMYDDELEIDDITKRLPELEVFAASPVYYSKDLKVIQGNCPNLKVVACNDYASSYFYVPSSSTSGHQHCIGVHTLYIDCYELNIFDLDPKDIVDFMKRNSHTLQHVYFYIPVGGSADEVPILNHAGDGALFKSLTTFINRIDDDDDVLLTRWIAQESPHLKEIVLSNPEGFAPNAVDTSALFDDLIGRCELESVIFDLLGEPTMDSGSIERFIQYHGTFDSLLHTLTLPKHSRLSKDALDTLTRLPRLESLSISWRSAQDEDQEEEESVHEKCSHFIGKLDRLQHLEIWSDEVVPDDVFAQLTKLNITSLDLNVPIPKLPKPTILLSLLQCPNLQELGIREFRLKDHPLLDEIRNMLKSKIETVHWV